MAVRKCVGCRREVSAWRTLVTFGDVCPYCGAAQSDLGAAQQGIAVVNLLFLGFAAVTLALYWLFGG